MKAMVLALSVLLTTSPTWAARAACGVGEKARTQAMPKGHSADVQVMADFLIPFVVQTLDRYGEFYPVAVAVDNGGRLQPVAVLMDDEHPRSTEVIAKLEGVLRTELKTRRYASALIAFDVYVTNPKRATRASAIKLRRLAHDGSTREYTLPYTLSGGKTRIDC